MNRKILYLALACIAIFSPALKNPGSSFAEQQLQNPRVAVAKKEKESVLKQLCKEKGIVYPVKNIFIRVFKKEAELEVWAKNPTGKAFKLLKTYKVCTVSGVLGPKRQEGDLQTPEGFYNINDFNPNSTFYLSLGVSYPNASDKIKAPDKSHLGGAIYIHGNCVSIGCMPIEDDGIKELYWLAVQAKANGQGKINVHIFPFRMDAENMKWAIDKYKDNPGLISFWNNLKPGYLYFEKSKNIPLVSVDKRGKYIIND
jgi:murein L,D-transpeptidase YafK